MKTISKFKINALKKKSARRVKEGPALLLAERGFRAGSARLTESRRPDTAFLYRSYGNRFFASTGIGGYMITSIKFSPEAVFVDNFFDVQEKL